jgi:ankyrin repeat protein
MIYFFNHLTPLIPPLAQQLNTTDIITAAKKGNITTLRLLLNCNDVDVDHRDIDGTTALLYASHHNHLDVARLLLKSIIVPTLSIKIGMELQH